MTKEFEPALYNEYHVIYKKKENQVYIEELEFQRIPFIDIYYY